MSYHTLTKIPFCQACKTVLNILRIICNLFSNDNIFRLFHRLNLPNAISLCGILLTLSIFRNIITSDVVNCHDSIYETESLSISCTIGFDSDYHSFRIAPESHSVHILERIGAQCRS